MSKTILGINSDKDSCDCCGKKSLKRVVWLDIDGDVVAYGTNCAARTLGMTKQYTAKTAECLVADYSEKQRRIEKLNRVCESAQKQANEIGEEIHVIRSNDNGYFTRREAANNGYLFKCPIRVFKPANLASCKAAS